jgi:putative ABC transport system permease protein
MRFSLPDVRYDSPGKVAAFYEQLLPRLRAIPGVKAAGVATTLPGQGYGGDSRLAIVEHPAPRTGVGQIAMIRAADPGYFRALQIPLLRGRFFADRERLQNAQSVIISRSFAAQYFPGEDPLGKHVLIGNFAGSHPGGFEIVGVAGDTLWDLAEPVGATLYVPLYSGDWTGAAIGVRSDLDVNSLALPIQTLLSQLDPDLPVSDVLTMQQSIGESTLDAGFTSSLVLVFAVIALLLAAVGLYGVLSFIVFQRTSEMAIRIALGAKRGRILQLVLLDGLRPVWAGMILGFAGSAFSVQLIRSLLYGAGTLDYSVFGLVVLLLSLVAALACVVPAWNASRLDPMQALRMQ